MSNTRFDSAVKNKAVAEYQITAEHLIREAFDNQIRMPYLDHKINDSDEFEHLIFMKRKVFEDGLRRNRYYMGVWINYANFEMQLKNFDRARSIFERSLEIDYRNVKIWYKYTDMEIRNKQFNYARNLFERAVNLLPKHDEFWLKYIQLETNQREFKHIMDLYQRWIANKPEKYVYTKACHYYTRNRHYELAKQVLVQLVLDYPEPDSWRRLAEFEERNSTIVDARGVYERALQFYGNNPPSQLLIFFAKFEQRQKQLDRCRQIYQYALDKYKDNDAIRSTIATSFQQFEQQIGDPTGITNAITLNKSHHFESLLKSSDPSASVDIWFEYIQMEESLLKDLLDNFPEFDKISDLKDIGIKQKVDKIRLLYNRALDNAPELVKVKWKRYAYLWIKCIVFEELYCHEIELAEQKIIDCLRQLLDKPFTIAKLWNFCALFYIRKKQPDMARKVFERGLSTKSTCRLYKYYIQMEIDLEQFDKARKLYESLICDFPKRVDGYVDYATFELEMENISRARAILQVCKTQNVDKNLFYKTFIEFEQTLGEYDKVIDLYEEWLTIDDSPTTWSNYALFMALVHVNKGRDIYKKAYEAYKQRELIEERINLLELWKNYEMMHGDAASVDSVIQMLPKLVKTKTSLGEKFEYIFPDSMQNNSSLKLLEMAKQWKKTQSK